MREILFRGKICETCKYQWEWLIGYYAVDNGKPIIAIPEKNGLNGFCCDPETIGQYTGLTDKNGVKIFEGDIVNVFYNPNYIGVSKDRVGNFIVVFHDSCFMKRKITKPMSDDAGLYHFIHSDEFEVIGNIYDNPELLGGM